VKDTYNLLADGIVKLARVLSRLAGAELGEWTQAHFLGRYFGTSLKGEAEIDWDDPKAKVSYLERETGLGPATTCLEGRHSTN
jgi:hypothetical protein